MFNVGPDSMFYFAYQLRESLPPSPASSALWHPAVTFLCLSGLDSAFALVFQVHDLRISAHRLSHRSKHLTQSVRTSIVYTNIYCADSIQSTGGSASTDDTYEEQNGER